MKWVLRVLIGLAAVLAAAVAVLAVMGMREDAGVSRASVEIAAPREQVWPWIVEAPKYKQWTSWVVDVETVNPAPGVGHKEVVRMKEPGSAETVRIETEWTEFAPPERFTGKAVFPGVFEATQSYQLRDAGQGRTLVELTSAVRYTTFLYRLLEPLGTPTATRKIESDLAGLKRLAEGDAKQAKEAGVKGRILGIGGIFFKSARHEQLREWYKTHLGLADQTMLPWRQKDDPSKEQMTVWSVFPASSTYMDPGNASFMINYIVDDMDAILARLEKEGVKIDPKRQDESYGRFAWIYDADGNKIELWQPLPDKP